MITVRLNGTKLKIPGCWEEITVSQYIQIVRDWEPEKDIADRDYFKLLNILANGRYSGMLGTSPNQVTLINAVGWVITQKFEFSKSLPKVLFYKGKKIDIPRDPAELSIGQNIHLRRKIEKTKLLEENIAMATAIYLQPLIDSGEFDLKRAEEIEKELEQLPVCIVYPIGFFLLKRVMKFGNRPRKIWPRLKTSLSGILSKMFPSWRRSTASEVLKIYR